MTGRLAIIAGQGRLPALLAEASARAGEPPIVAALEGFAPDGVAADLTFRLERLVPLLRHLARADVRRIVLAGAIRRPVLDPSLFDPETASLVPRILSAIKAGDDAALREIIAIFEDGGFAVLGAADIAPDLVPGAGLLCGETGETDRTDAERAAQIVTGLGALDIGQGAVVAQGLCLATEALPGTDAMLDFVARHAAALRPDPKGARGLLYKAPKPGQDRRADLPAIGPDTVARVAAAGLGGIVWEAGGVMLIDRDAVVARARERGLFLWAREP